MAVVVIGGQARGIGKTGVVCSLIAGMRGRRPVGIPQFAMRGPGYESGAFLEFLAQELHKKGK